MFIKNSIADPTYSLAYETEMMAILRSFDYDKN